MAETVVIEFQGDPSGLKPLADALRALGQLTEQQEQALNDAAKAYENLGKSTKATTSEADKLNKAFQEFQEGIIGGATAEFSKQMAGLGMEVTKTTEKSKTMVGQLRALKQELATLDVGSKQFQKVAIEAAKLEDKIDKINRRIRTLASDTLTLDTITGAVRGLAGGFAVAQGAAALFGKENEDVQKALLKVNAAMAILQGLQEVSLVLNKNSTVAIGLQSAAQKAYTFVTEGATAATRAFNAALLGVGAGVVIAAIGLLISNWQELAKWIGLATDKEKEHFDVAEEFLIKNKQATERIKSNFSIAEKSSKDLQDELSTLKDSLDDLGRNGLELIVNGQKIKQDTTKARLEILKQIAEIQKELDKRGLVFIKEENLERQLLEVKDKIEQFEPIEIPVTIKTTTEGGNITPDSLEGLISQEKERQDAIMAATLEGAQQTSDALFEITQARRDAEIDAELSALDAQRERELNNKDLTENQRAAIEAKYRKKEAKIKEDAFKAQKKADIVSAIINGALAAAKTIAVLGAPPSPAGIAGLATVAATTALSIATIAAQPIPKFRKGTKSAPGGLAIVGEEGSEIVAHEGQMSVVGKGLTYLPQGAKVIPHPESLKILQGHPDTVDIMKDYDIKQATGTHGIDVGTLGKAIGNELRKNQRVTVNIDEHGFNIFVEKGNQRRNYLNKMFGEQ